MQNFGTEGLVGLSGRTQHFDRPPKLFLNVTVPRSVTSQKLLLFNFLPKFFSLQSWSSTLLWTDFALVQLPL